MSELTASILHAQGAIRIDREGAETAIDIPASGILTISELGGASITLGNGGASELLGIIYLDETGAPVVLERHQSDEKFLRTVPGVTITLRHNATADLQLNAIPLDQRLITSTGNDIELTVENTPTIRAWAIAPLESFVWGVVDRKGYVAADPGNWAPEPTTVWTALDQLAASTAGIGATVIDGSSALTSGVPEPLWTRTLAEGDVFGGKVTIIGRAEDLGDTLRSIISAEFVASRSTGGNAELTTVNLSENGTLPGGSATLEASGNDIVLSITAVFTGDLDWKAVVSLHTLTA